jgi:tRNA(adenine34) deaminase
MREALKSARRSLKSEDVPVGAVIVKDGVIIGRGYNSIERKNNPMEHAEMAAIRTAIKKTGYKHLLDCDMYVTLEPCSMCAGAIVLARIRNLFIGAPDPKTGASGSLYSITEDKRLNHRCNVIRGILEKECSQIIKDFFKSIRDKKKNER